MQCIGLLKQDEDRVTACELLKMDLSQQVSESFNRLTNDQKKSKTEQSIHMTPPNSQRLPVRSGQRAVCLQVVFAQAPIT